MMGVPAGPMVQPAAGWAPVGIEQRSDRLVAAEAIDFCQQHSGMCLQAAIDHHDTVRAFHHYHIAAGTADQRQATAQRGAGECSLRKGGMRQTRYQRNGAADLQ